MLTQARLKELLSYNPIDGCFIWRISLPGRGGNVKEGRVAGSRDSKGKLQIKVDGEIYFAHRLAFLYMEGCFPAEHVDHINRDTSDNRWSNLRHASPVQNMMNRSFSRLLPRGVYVTKYGTIYAAIQLDNKLKYIGSFSTVDAAHEAYMAHLRSKPSFSHFVGL